MRMIHTDPELAHLESRVIHWANEFGMTLPEIRFYILNSMEFASLLEKRVYPVSPINIWEGKRMISKKYRIQSGLESSLYYEVVQTGNPSYAYLNNTNSAMVQATVMAHVCGHCEFSEINVLQDSTQDRTEFVMWLTKKVNNARRQMGEKSFITYWNAAESAIPMVNPNSRFNLSRSIETDHLTPDLEQRTEEKPKERELYTPFSSTMESLLRAPVKESAYEVEMKSKRRQETLSRKGYRLKAPCQDIFGFLKNFAPCTASEHAVMDYLYTIHYPTDFVIKTQIMNEGWAMYWEKKIMMELFKEKACTGIIDYAKIFSGVCFPRPYYQRNPYHLGFHMWNHIEELFRKGKVSLDFHEETDREARDRWDKGDPEMNPLDEMRKLVRTTTDYEFLRRFLTSELITEFHLNRIPQRDFVRLGISKREVIKEDRRWVWLRPDGIKGEMLRFFTHYYRPRIYIIDTDFEDGGLLLYHRDDGRRLRTNWIQPTLKNINHLWKGAVALVSRNTLFSYHAGRYSETSIREISFDTVQERIMDGKKPLVLG